MRPDFPIRPRAVRLAAALSIVALVATACGAPGERAGSEQPPGVPGTSTAVTTTVTEVTTTVTEVTTTLPGPPPSRGVAVVPVGGADLSETAGGTPFVRLHEGIALPVQSRSGEQLEVLTTCGTTAWVDESTVDFVGRADNRKPGPGFDFAQAVVVLDPGHGAADWGGVGPTDLGEKAVNLDIAVRLRSLLLAPHSVDWATGAIRAGDDVPAVSYVFLTRDPAGPDDGDYQAVLAYRAALGTDAGADALVAIHNNTAPNRDLDGPGTEVYYSVGAEGSDRLAGLVYEEVVRSLSRFDADWQGGYEPGAVARVHPDTKDDYYTLLRRATVPSVIVEGAYISNPSEEALLKTEAFRQAYAEGVYRGLVRFLTTDDSSPSVYPPVDFDLEVGSPSTRGCELPAQSGS